MIPADLQHLVNVAKTRYHEHTLDQVCAAVGVGVRALQSRERTAEIALRRSVVAWLLYDRLNWPQARIATALRRTPRQVKRMLRNHRVVSPFGGT